MPKVPVSRSYLRMFVILLCPVLICTSIYRVGSAFIHNERLQIAFVEGAHPSPYQQGFPMNEMDLAFFSSYLPTVQALPLYDLTARITSPITLHYYTEIPSGKSEPALVIQKGTDIIAISERFGNSMLHEIGYGFTSFPTYVQGWRYVRPFRLADGTTRSQDNQHYYIRIEALEAVIGEVIQANRVLQVAIQQQGWNIQTGKRQIATYMDQLLYQHGAYLSPDLYHKVIDRWSILMICAVLLVILLWFASSFLSHKRIFHSS